MISRTQALLHGALFALFIGGAFVIAPGASAQSTAASGLIKEASAGLAVHAFEQVTIGQVIDLGASGHLKITYYASCLVETIDGGTVTVGSFGSRVVGGKIATTTDKKSCKTTQVATTASTAESGAAIERVMAFDPRDWSETTVSVARPRFQPSASVATPVKLRILMLDNPAPKLIWEGAVKTVPATYPASAPKLLVGRPYKVELVGADGSKYSSTFSIDPGYVTDNGSVASTVLVSP